jgi:streptomycin 6-kinase
MDTTTEKLVRRFGSSVTSWAAGLPALLATLADRWDLTVGEPFAEGASSVAVRVTTGDGRRAVLKLSPDLPFVAEQVAVLRQFGPSGRVPEVLADDPTVAAVLMTEIRPGTTVHELPVPPSPAEFAALLTALHGVAPPQAGVLPRELRQWTDEFMHRAMDRLGDPVVGAHVNRADFALAQRHRDRLLATSAPTVLLHGDLHLRNVLDGGDRGLVAIDPKACLGDPCFDAVDYVAAGAGVPGGVAHRLTGLADAGGLDPERVLGWCLATVPILVLPMLRDGRERAAAELLALLRR